MTTLAALMPTLARPGWDAFLPDLMTQTRPADRIVVVVDRPTDEAERADFRQRWPGVTFVFNAANRGITASLNAGLAACDGFDVIARVDDDDRCLPHRFARQLALLDASGADLVTGWAEASGEDGGTYLVTCPCSHAGIAAALMRRNCLLHPTLAFRRDAVVALGGYDETFLNAQDYALYLAALRAGLRFAAVPEPLVQRSYRPDTVTVGRRYHQMMYSCAARAVHHAASGNRTAFLRTLAQYAVLAATPAWSRRLRRRGFALLGRGR